MTAASTLRAVPLWLGAVTGVLSGLLGIGGGLVIGPSLALRGLELSRATGTALAVVLPVACVAVLTEAIHAPAQLHLLLALTLAIGGQVGARLGSAILKSLPAGGLRLAFLLLLLYFLLILVLLVVLFLIVLLLFVLLFVLFLIVLLLYLLFVLLFLVVLLLL